MTLKQQQQQQKKKKKKKKLKPMMGVPMTMLWLQCKT
jgi:hypothetical protein